MYIYMYVCIYIFCFHHTYIYMFKSCLYLKQWVNLPILLKRQICVDLHYPTQNQKISEFRRIIGRFPRF